MRRDSRASSALTVMALSLVGLVGCAKAPASESTDTILIGDSLGEESLATIGLLTWPSRTAPWVFGGTAPCDWTDDAIRYEDTSIVVLTFTGNSQTACMTNGAGGYLRGQALVDRYRADVKVLVERARAAGAWVILVGQPARANDPAGAAEVDGLNAMYRQLAAEKFVAFVDAGASVENADGSAASFLPCGATEIECGPDGMNQVRNDDGVHLCPGAYINPCPVYSSGAWRFGNAIAAAVDNPTAYD